MFQTIANLFNYHGWAWSYTDGPHIPTPEEIKDVVDEMVEKAGEGDQVAMGRLIVERYAGKVDVYVMVGEDYENN